jgi:predicted TIM-barrel fold metal-dependent hydrolase
MEFVDAQVHLNRLAPNWEQADAATLVHGAVATMDAIGLSAVLIDEWAGFANPVTKRGHLPGHLLPNGAMRGEHPFSETAVEHYPDRFAYVVRIDPLDPELESLMAGVRTRPGARCLRIVPIPEAGELELYERGGFDPLFSAAERRNVPIFCWFPGRSHMLAPTLEKFPSLQLILDHCGLSREEGNFAHQLDQVCQMGRFPNLALKWCHAPSQLSKQAYPFADVLPYLRRAIDAFGAERIMWASDHTQSKTHHSWAEALFYLRDSNQLSATEKEWLLGRSVRTILRWGDHHDASESADST